MSVIPENPVFPNPVLPKTSVIMNLEINTMTQKYNRIIDDAAMDISSEKSRLCYVCCYDEFSAG